MTIFCDRDFRIGCDTHAPYLVLHISHNLIMASHYSLSIEAFEPNIRLSCKVSRKACLWSRVPFGW
jgi:hypothetical protein